MKLCYHLRDAVYDGTHGISWLLYIDYVQSFFISIKQLNFPMLKVEPIELVAPI